MKVLNKIVPDKGLINNTLNFSEENYTTNVNIIKVIIERIKKIKSESTNEFEKLSFILCIPSMSSEILAIKSELSLLSLEIFDLELAL